MRAALILTGKQEKTYGEIKKKTEKREKKDGRKN